MKKRCISLSIIVALCFFSSIICAAPSFLDSNLAKPKILINNRILAKVNGKAISVLDVSKKMDLVFHREYPQYADNIEAKYQFYSQFWPTIFDHMIDEELILANAEEVKLAVTDGDARQELEEMFGPNAVLNIDKIGMTYPEALKLILNEITVKRMDYIMVHSKALNRVGPKEVKAAYEKYAKEHPVEASWTYQVISIRSPAELSSATIAKTAYNMLIKDKTPIDKLPDQLKSKGLLKDKSTVNISEEYTRTEQAISTQHKEILLTLTPQSYSEPVKQVSRSDKSTVFRIFYLKDQTKAGVVPFADVAEKLKAKLLDEASAEESELYHKRLRERFGINEDYLSTMIPKGFEPFTLSTN